MKRRGFLAGLIGAPATVKVVAASGVSEPVAPRCARVLGIGVASGGGPGKPGDHYAWDEQREWTIAAAENPKALSRMMGFRYGGDSALTREEAK